MPKITIKQSEQGKLIVDSGQGVGYLYRRLRYPTKSVPIPYKNATVLGTYNPWFDTQLPTHTTLLEGNKALLHAHVYNIGMYHTLVVTDNRDEVEYDFNITQSTPDTVIPFDKYTEIANDALVVTGTNSTILYNIRVDDNVIYIIPVNEKESASTICITYKKNAIIVECEKPKHKMRMYVPAAVYLATEIVDYTHLYITYGAARLKEIDELFAQFVSEIKAEHKIDQEQVIDLTALRYLYFRRFCKAMDAINALPKGKELVHEIDALSNCSFNELQGSSHWLYDIAQSFIEDCIKTATSYNIQHKVKKDEDWF